VILENFAHVFGRCREDSREHVVIASLGDLLGAKGVIVNSSCAA